MDQPKNKGGRPRTGKRPTLNEARSQQGFYNHREVADIFGLHPDTVHSLTRIGRIPVERVQKGLPDSKGNLRHDLYYPKEAIDALKARLTSPQDYINGVGSFPCDKCNADVPIKDVVSHEKAHKQQDLLGGE